MFRTVLSIVSVLLVAGVAFGQPSRPPGGPLTPIPKKQTFGPGFIPGRGNAALDRDDSIEDPRPFLGGLLGKTAPKDVNPKDLKDLLDKLNKLPKDQQPDKAQLEELLKSPAFKDPKFLEQLDKMLRDPDFPKNLEGKLPDGSLPDKEQGPQLADKLKEVMESGKQQGAANPEIPKGMEPPKIDPSAVDPSKVPTPETKNPYTDNEWVKWMEKNFGDSPAAQDAVKDLVNSLQKGDLKGMFDDVPELKNSGWKDFADWGKSNGLDLSKVKPPDVSTGKSGPTIGGNSGGSGWPSGGGGGGGGGGVGLGGGGTALAVIAGIAGALFLALLLFRRWKLDQARRAAHGAGGPNGFDYDSVRTREELVRAFDHVSLNQIGEDARSWNHRVIADQFAEVKPAQAVPAAELAGLYERARYAPLDEDLSAGDFVDARRDLRAIAETPA
jgi:hypothetical protein